MLKYMSHECKYTANNVNKGISSLAFFKMIFSKVAFLQKNAYCMCNTK